MRPSGKLNFLPFVLLWLPLFLALSGPGIPELRADKLKGKVAFEFLGGMGLGAKDRTAHQPQALAETAEAPLSAPRSLDSPPPVADRISPHQTKIGLEYHFPLTSRQGGGGTGGVLPPLTGHSPPLG